MPAYLGRLVALAYPSGIPGQVRPELQLFTLAAKHVKLIEAGSLALVPWADVYVSLSAQAQTLSEEAVRAELGPMGMEELQAQAAMIGGLIGGLGYPPSAVSGAEHSVEAAFKPLFALHVRTL